MPTETNGRKLYQFDSLEFAIFCFQAGHEYQDLKQNNNAMVGFNCVSNTDCFFSVLGDFLLSSEKESKARVLIRGKVLLFASCVGF